MKRLLLSAAMFCCVVCSKAQTSTSNTPPGSIIEPSVALNAMLSGTENQMMSLVKAMPADKYDFAPSAAIFVPSQKTDFSGVRTFGALVIHVTQANYGFGARFGGIKPDVDLKSLAQLKDKDQIVAALAASFAFLHKAIGTITTANAFESVNAPGGGSVTRATAAGGVVVHTADEYGQMVEYLRMNGVIPPASVK
nr:DinB family protein [Granulicella sp. dw_53]